MAGKNFDISKFAATLKPVSESDTMLEIPAADILDNPANFYPAPDSEALRALMDSIRANGLLEPPTVVPAEGGKYRLISGHSRMAAIKALRATEMPDQWATVLCRVLPPMTEEQEATAVIEANRQRVKSPALLAEEAERLTKLYTQRKQAGEDLPGRIRDRVAAALQVNPTKLANVGAIKKGLKVPEIRQAWEEQEIPEAAALEIARMDLDAQYRLLDWITSGQRPWTIREVRKFSTIWTCCRHKCPHTAGLCPNAEAMYGAKYKGGEWLCPGCCEYCLNKATCETACRYIERAPEPPTPEPQEAAAPEETPEPLPECQMVLAAWMPGSVTPAEPGEFAVVVDGVSDKPLKRFFDWDGEKWLMSNGIEAQIVPSWWMRLPPLPAAGEGDEND